MPVQDREDMPPNLVEAANFPVLGAILSLISLKKSVFYGAVCLFIFSLGQGLILIILGTSTALLKKLPRQGKASLAIKKVFALILILVGASFFIKFISLIR